MIFPITGLLDDKRSSASSARYAPAGSPTVYRCSECEGTYNLYSGTLFEKKHLRPSQVVLLLRGGGQRGVEYEPLQRARGEPQHSPLSAQRATVQRPEAPTGRATYRQAHGDRRDVPERGGKEVRDMQIRTIHPEGAPTSGAVTAPTTDRRDSGQRGKRNGTGKAAGGEKHRSEDPDGTRSHGYTRTTATSYTDEWRAYERVRRVHRTVSHGLKEWARDDDGDGIREVCEHHRRIMDDPAQLLEAVWRSTQEVSGRLCGDV
jgi:hypothetical protein